MAVSPVTFVVGYSAGGSTDINARELAQVMTPVIGQQIIIDNKGGAAGSIGLRAVASAKPDGSTLFVAVGTNVIINPHVQKGMIDTIAALAPICQITDYQYVLVVGNSVPAKKPPNWWRWPRRIPTNSPTRRRGWAATTTSRARSSPKQPASR